MNIDKNKTQSIRKVFGNTLAQVGELNPNVVVLDADLSCSTQTKIFADKFPDRFFNCGIAEQNMIATAAGLATQGKIPFASTFAMFATGRTYDQIRNGVCYSDLDVKIVGTHGGVTVGEDGATHQALEDVALMREIPHMTVIVPADAKECEEVVKYASLHHGPMYIRLSRCNVPDIFDENYHFNLHKAVTVEEGSDEGLLRSSCSARSALDHLPGQDQQPGLHLDRGGHHLRHPDLCKRGRHSDPLRRLLPPAAGLQGPLPGCRQGGQEHGALL